MKPLIAYVLCSLPGLCALSWMVVREEWSVAHGRELVLDTRPVDPMSLFSGRYATVNFAIDLALREVPGPVPRPLRGTRVYTWLEQRGEWWVPVRVALEKPADPAVPFVRGEFQYGDSIHYNATRFYIPHEGRDPAQASRDQGGVQARVSVDDSGRVRLVDLIVEGQPYEQWSRSKP